MGRMSGKKALLSTLSGRGLLTLRIGIFFCIREADEVFSFFFF